MLRQVDFVIPPFIWKSYTYTHCPAAEKFRFIFLVINSLKTTKNVLSSDNYRMWMQMLHPHLSLGATLLCMTKNTN